MNYPEKKSINNSIAVFKEPVIAEDSLPIFQKLFEKDIRENTRKAFVSDLKHFVGWFVMENNEPFSFARLTTRDIADYKRYCHEKLEHAPRTINRRLASIKTLCLVASKEGKLEKDPSVDIKQLALQPLAPKKLERSELRALLREAELRKARYDKFIRDVLILHLMRGAGLRVSEVVHLKVKDVEITERKGSIHIKNGKGGKDREVPLNLTLRDLIKEYLDSPYHYSDYLIVGQRGEMTPIAINKMLEFYSRKAGVKCSPHCLRHTFSYNYLEQNPDDIVGLSQILGHSNLNTTAIYTKHGLEDLQERIDKVVY